MKKIITLIILAMVYCNVNAQITLKSHYKCIKSKTSYRDNKYYDGNVYFHSEVYNAEKLTGKQLADVYSEAYGLPFYKTKDNLWYCVGYANGINNYIIIVPETQVALSAKSKADDEYFSYECTWLLKQIKANRKNGKPIYITGVNKCN